MENYCYKYRKLLDTSTKSSTKALVAGSIDILEGALWDTGYLGKKITGLRYLGEKLIEYGILRTVTGDIEEENWTMCSKGICGRVSIDTLYCHL